MFRPNRHWSKKHAGLRAVKVQKIELPNIERDRQLNKAQDIEKQRENMKKRGTLPVTPAQLPVYFSCSSGVFDDKIIHKEMGESMATKIKDKTLKMGKSFRATRKIRKYDDDFDPRAFASIAEEIYIKAHSALAERRHKELHEYVTEYCYPVRYIPIYRYVNIRITAQAFYFLTGR